MKVLDRKLLRELRLSGLLLLAISGIMASGVACYVAMGSAYRNLTSAQRSYYRDCRMADFSIELKRLPLAEIDRVARLPGVVEVRPRIQYFATIDLPRAAEPLNALVLSLPDERQSVLSDILLERGGYFTPRRANEVIVNESFARRHGLHPGGWIHLLLNNQRQELFIVGTAISSEFIYLVGPGAVTPDPDHFGVFYLKQSFAEEAFQMQGAANQVLGLLAPHLCDAPEKLLDQAERALDDFGVFATVPLSDQPSHRFIDNEIQGLGTFGKIMPGIFLAVAAIVLNVLMARVTEQQRVVVGTLKALGYSNLQVFGHFLKFGLAVGLGGGLVGCGVGYLMSGFMTRIYQQFFQFPSLYNRWYPETWAEGLVISVVCGFTGTLYGARRVLRLEPAEAMRPRPPRHGGRIVLERWKWLWSRLGFGWRMTLRNVVRQRLRTAAGIFAAAMGAAIMVNGIMLAQASVHMVDFQFSKVLRSDFDLQFKDEHGREAWDEVRGLPGVDRAEPLLDVACAFRFGAREKQGGITGLLPDARLTMPRDQDELPLTIPENGVCLSRKLAEILGASVGDVVIVEPVQGRRDPRRVAVTQVADTYLGLSAYADIRFLSRLVDEEFCMTGAQISVDPRPQVRQALFVELKQLPALQAVSSRAHAIANVMETLVKNQQVFIGLLVMFAGLIFFGSVLNSSLVSLAERTREVATWRVQGYTPWQVGGLFLRESVIVNGLGTLVGLPLGYELAVWVTHAYDTEMFRIPVVNPARAWTLTILLGAAFGLAAHALVQRTIHRLNWLEALQAKE